MGLPPELIVPTLLTCSFKRDESQPEPPEFVEEEDGEWTPSFEVADLLEPINPGTELTLQTLLDHHRAIVLKPTKGTNSVGVLCMSVEAAEPLRYVPRASGERRPRQTAPSQLPDDCIWSFMPHKAVSQVDDYESVRALRRNAWFHELILTQASMFRSGGERELAVEPLISYDQEISVLAINGGLVQVLAGRTNCMERLLMIQGHETIVASSDFAAPSCRKFVLSASERARHTAMVLQQVVRGDAAGRTVHEVIRSAVSNLAKKMGSSAFRADFFVKWGNDSAGGAGAEQAATDTGRQAPSSPRDVLATVHLNEIENWFGAGSMVGWFGMPLTDYAMRSWALGSDVAQQHRFIDVSFASATAASEAAALAAAALAAAALAAAALAAASTALAAVELTVPLALASTLPTSVEAATSATDADADGGVDRPRDHPSQEWNHGWSESWAGEHGAHMFARIPSVALGVPCSAWLSERPEVCSRAHA